MYGLKIFVRVQTFRRGPPRNFSHPVHNTKFVQFFITPKSDHCHYEIPSLLFSRLDSSWWRMAWVKWSCKALLVHATGTAEVCLIFWSWTLVMMLMLKLDRGSKAEFWSICDMTQEHFLWWKYSSQPLLCLSQCFMIKDLLCNQTAALSFIHTFIYCQTSALAFSSSNEFEASVLNCDPSTKTRS